jgi:hypothetical protein
MKAKRKPTIIESHPPDSGCQSCAWALSHAGDLVDKRTREAAFADGRRIQWLTTGSHWRNFSDARKLDGHLRNAGFSVRRAIAIVSWWTTERERERLPVGEPGSWSWKVRELERRGLATPDSIDQLGRERWGILPLPVAICTKLWRRAIERDRGAEGDSESTRGTHPGRTSVALRAVSARPHADEPRTAS